MGCDGVWERHEKNGQDLVDIIRNERMNGKPPEQVLEGLLDSFLAETNK